MSNECDQHANKRSKERGVDGILAFVQSPIESIGHRIDNQEDNFDVIISKKKGFAECHHRLFKSGGRIAICTTMIKNNNNNTRFLI